MIKIHLVNGPLQDKIFYWPEKDFEIRLPLPVKEILADFAYGLEDMPLPSIAVYRRGRPIKDVWQYYYWNTV